MDSFSISIAFSTGITCIPIPAPPGGTIGVIFSKGRRLIRSKNLPISGYFSKIVAFMLENSALPGTNIGSTYCFSCCGFSQLYSITPEKDISSKSFSRCSFLSPVSFTSSSSVFGLRTPILRATSAISSVKSRDNPQYSGSYFVNFLSPNLCKVRFVTIFPSFMMTSRSSSFSTKSGTKSAR